VPTAWDTHTYIFVTHNLPVRLMLFYIYRFCVPPCTNFIVLTLFRRIIGKSIQFRRLSFLFWQDQSTPRSTLPLRSQQDLKRESCSDRALRHDGIDDDCDDEDDASCVRHSPTRRRSCRGSRSAESGKHPLDPFGASRGASTAYNG
jgi:hypothetical protein